MKILYVIVGLLIGDILPAAAVVLLFRLIARKKMSKGWCISAFILSAMCSFFIGSFVLGHPIKLGFIDYAVHFVIISLFLYDKDAPSFLDTEKEILRKRELYENKNNEKSI